MVWSGNKNNSYSTFALLLLRGRQEQHCCFKANVSSFLGAAFISFFNVHRICQWAGISGLRGVVGELQQAKLRRLLSKNASIWKRAAEDGIVSTNSACGCLKLEWLTWILHPRNSFLRKFARGQSAKILSLEKLALCGICIGMRREVIHIARWLVQRKYIGRNWTLFRCVHVFRLHYHVQSAEISLRVGLIHTA